MMLNPRGTASFAILAQTDGGAEKLGYCIDIARTLWLLTMPH
jgi:hypothetical protein